MLFPWIFFLGNKLTLGAGGVFGSAFTFLGFLGGLAAAGFVILLGEGIVQATLCRRSLRKNGCNKGLKSSNWDFLGGWWSYPWAPQKFKIWTVDLLFFSIIKINLNQKFKSSNFELLGCFWLCSLTPRPCTFWNFSCFVIPQNWIVEDGLVGTPAPLTAAFFQSQSCSRGLLIQAIAGQAFKPFRPFRASLSRHMFIPSLACMWGGPPLSLQPSFHSCLQHSTPPSSIAAIHLFTSPSQYCSAGLLQARLPSHVPLAFHRPAWMAKAAKSSSFLATIWPFFQARCAQSMFHQSTHHLWGITSLPLAHSPAIFPHHPPSTGCMTSQYFSVAFVTDNGPKDGLTTSGFFFFTTFGFT